MSEWVVEMGVRVGLAGHLLNIVLYGTWLGIAVSHYTRPEYRAPLAMFLVVAFFVCTIAGTAFAVLGGNYFGFISAEAAQVVFRFVRLFAALLLVAYTAQFLLGHLDRAEWRH
jgi:hypothetical protein